MMKTILLYLLKIYQNFFTLLGYGSCRYYPTCSEYAKWQFEKNSFLYALINSFLRILRCNQLFRGGTDYPIVKTPTINCYKKIDIRYWYVPKNKEFCYLIKSF